MVVHLLGIGRFNSLVVLLIHWVLAQKSNIKAAPQTLKKHERLLNSFSFCPVLHAGSHTFSPPSPGDEQWQGAGAGGQAPIRITWMKPKGSSCPKFGAWTYGI